MIESDEARWGRFLLGIVQIIDTNTATPEMILALARGCKRACDQGRFALLNGETAELGYRVSGYGSSRINWNAVGVSLIVPDKLILGQNLEAGQPIVALRETSIRSNGLTKARQILEAAYIQSMGAPSKEDLTLDMIANSLELVQDNLPSHSLRELLGVFDEVLGHDFTEQILQLLLILAEVACPKKLKEW